MNITIEKVANGWIVKPLHERNAADWQFMPRPENVFVYNDIEDLERGLADLLKLELKVKIAT